MSGLAEVELFIFKGKVDLLTNLKSTLENLNEMKIDLCFRAT